jgi:hypothetical protein
MSCTRTGARPWRTETGPPYRSGNIEAGLDQTIRTKNVKHATVGRCQGQNRANRRNCQRSAARILTDVNDRLTDDGLVVAITVTDRDVTPGGAVHSPRAKRPTIARSA